MNGLELSTVNQSAVATLRAVLGKNLFAVISIGSVASGAYMRSWSDVDMLVVVEKLNLVEKKKIAQATYILEKKYKKHFGINVITKLESTAPCHPVISLEGKTLQALLELRYDPKRLLFCKSKSLSRFYFPSALHIKEYSIMNIAMFSLRSRRTLTRKLPKTFKEDKEGAEKNIRAAFIMTKLAVQYLTLHICKDKYEIIQKAEELCDGFNFDVLKKNLEIIDKWNSIRTYKELEVTSISTDNFIEKFSHYMLEKASLKA